MTQPNPEDYTADGLRGHHQFQITAPLQIPDAPTWRHIGPGAEEVTAKVNRDNGIATLAWLLVLVVLASAVPLVVGAWRAAF